MAKTKQISNFLDKFTKDSFGMSVTEGKMNQICFFCKEDASNFKDELSRKEFRISGLCQKCQDEVFGE